METDSSTGAIGPGDLLVPGQGESSDRLRLCNAPCDGWLDERREGMEDKARLRTLLYRKRRTSYTHSGEASRTATEPARGHASLFFFVLAANLRNINFKV